MPHYEDSKGRTYFLTDLDVETGQKSLLPADIQEITEERAEEVIRPLSVVQDSKKAELVAAYHSALATPVSFTTKAGKTALFDGSPFSLSSLQAPIVSYARVPIPPDYFWVAQDNTQVSFCYEDLLGLSDVITAKHWGLFQNLQAKKLKARTASTKNLVNAITF